jgi:pectate lyase
VVIRYLRVRNGTAAGKDDALNGHSARNVVIDHCSLSWAPGQNLSLYRPSKAGGAGPCANVTVQWTISGECLERRRHAFGGTVGGRDCSYHHNLFACNLAWEPGPFIAARPTTERLDFRNNVVFVWRNRPLTGAARGGTVNLVGNYFRPDEAVLARGADAFRFAKPEREPKKSDDPRWGRWYVADNAVHGSARTTADNWAGVELVSGAKETDVRAGAPFPAAPVAQQPAAVAYELVLAGAGATLPRRDAVDERIVAAVRSGAPSREATVNFATAQGVVSWPEYRPGEPPADSDHDGIPDWWEAKYGLNPHDPADASKDLSGDGYTNLEKYLNGIDPTKKIDFRDPANNKDTLTAAGLAKP